MTAFQAFLGGLAVMASTAYGATDFGGKDSMGPAAFMWPADRVWSAAMDNTAPCGSVAGPGNRTGFPLTNANVALVGQDESYDIQLSISYLDDPKSNNDFTVLIDAEHFKAIDPGHHCVPVNDAPSSVNVGDNATLQIMYIADFDKPENQTFYACADITFIEYNDLRESIPCFNASTPSSEGGSSHGGSSSPSSSESSSPSSSSGGGGGGLSGGAIAGIVIGAVAAVALVALVAFLFYRRKSRNDAIARQQATARGVPWEEQPPKDSQSGASIRMNNL